MNNGLYNLKYGLNGEEKLIEFCSHFNNEEKIIKLVQENIDLLINSGVRYFELCIGNNFQGYIIKEDNQIRKSKI